MKESRSDIRKEPSREQMIVSDEGNVTGNVRDDLCVHRPLMTRQLAASFSPLIKNIKKKHFFLSPAVISPRIVFMY